MTKELKHIKKHTYYIDAGDLQKVYLTSTKQIACQYEMDGLEWSGEIQKIYLDNGGEAVGYDVYLY